MATLSSVESVPAVVVGDAGRAAGSKGAPPKDATARPTVDAASATGSLRSASDDAEVEQSKDAKKAEADTELSPEEAANLAERLSEKINDAYGTQLKFNVTPKKIGNNTFSFQVVDSSTGEVVREFPSKAVKAITEGTNLQEGQGVFVDAPV